MTGDFSAGYFAPLSPAPTGVADYAAALLAALRKLGRVEVGGADAGVALYQLGNNQLHRTIYRRALERPGVALLHDAVLHHFFLGTLDEAAYIEEFVYNYGEWMRGFAGELWRNRARSMADSRYFDYPMLKRIAMVSHAVIVHNPAAARAVRRHAPEARVVEIPHLFVKPDPPVLADTLRFRAELGLGPRTLLAGVFGHLRESKRLQVVLRAMRRAWNLGADARLLIAGEFVSSDLERALTPLLTAPRIARLGRLSEHDFWRYTAAIDVCVNLRFPSAGETSGIAVRMMGIGKAVVFTAGEEIARLPENSCVRIDVGPAEEEMLTATILWLARNREVAEEIGQNAAKYIVTGHDAGAVAEQFWKVLQTSRRP